MCCETALLFAARAGEEGSSVVNGESLASGCQHADWLDAVIADRLVGAPHVAA
jgi:hypothetical protein